MNNLNIGSIPIVCQPRKLKTIWTAAAAANDLRNLDKVLQMFQPGDIARVVYKHRRNRADRHGPLVEIIEYGPGSIWVQVRLIKRNTLTKVKRTWLKKVSPLEAIADQC